MPLSAGEIQHIHAGFGRVEELVERRRAIYDLVLDLADPEMRTSDGVRSAAVLDNPGVRAHLGEVLGGIAEYDRSRISSVEDHARARSVPGAAGVIRLASTPASFRALAGALRRVGLGLGRVDFDTDPATLVLADSASFDEAERMLIDGIALAFDAAPELAGDLLPHVALFAVLHADLAARLGSASVREFPGLVLIPEPRTLLEVAEALVHEGAHQKFFDLAMTRSVLGDRDVEHFRPPWSTDGASAWPLEQCVAAFHAYTCLATFADAVDGRFAVHPGSLLPHAVERAQLLGEWLHAYDDALGPEGRILVGKLRGRPVAVPSAHADAMAAVSRMRSSANPVRVRQCGDWTIVMEWSRPVGIVWLRTDVFTESGFGPDIATSQTP